MSDTPPFFAITGSTPAIGAAVLLVGRPTCPFCVTEGDGGDPDAWGAEINHETLKTLNTDVEITITISGTFNTNKRRVLITESGDAAGCARRQETVDGITASTTFSFVDTVALPKWGRYMIADFNGTLAQSGTGSVTGSPQTDPASIEETVATTALCGSTGCTVGELPNTDDSASRDLLTSWGAGLYVENVCRKENTETYRYEFKYENFVQFSSGAVPIGVSDSVSVFLYTGTFDEARMTLGNIAPPLPLPSGYVLTGEATVGTIRGVDIKARYVVFSHDHTASTEEGIESECPSPFYSLDVTTGSTVGTITVVVEETP